MPEDKIKIMDAIGDDSQQLLLDNTVHGRVAVAALRTALEEGGETKQQFLAAVKAGGVRNLQLDLNGSAADTEQNVAAVIEALNPHILQELHISNSTTMSVLPDAICRFTSLRTLKLRRVGLTCLPSEFGSLSLAGDL